MCLSTISHAIVMVHLFNGSVLISMTRGQTNATNLFLKCAGVVVSISRQCYYLDYNHQENIQSLYLKEQNISDGDEPRKRKPKLPRNTYSFFCQLARDKF